MKKQSLCLPILGGICAVVLGGCSYSGPAWIREPATPAHPAGEIVLAQRLIPNRCEIETPVPEGRRVWVEGYWIYGNRKWTWIPAHARFDPHSASPDTGTTR